MSHVLWGKTLGRGNKYSDFEVGGFPMLGCELFYSGMGLEEKRDMICDFNYSSSLLQITYNWEEQKQGMVRRFIQNFFDDGGLA